MIKSEVLNVIDTYNVVTGAIVAVLSAILGPHWYLFAAFLLLNIIDGITGWYKARKLKTETSQKGWEGVAKKLGYWIMIGVAFLMAYIFDMLGQDFMGLDLSFMMVLGWFVLASLLINEIRSIIENLVEIGCTVPEILIKGLAVTDKLINQAQDAVIPEESEENKNED